jgi:hypothetical protein
MGRAHAGSKKTKIGERISRLGYIVSVLIHALGSRFTTNNGAAAQKVFKEVALLRKRKNAVFRIIYTSIKSRPFRRFHKFFIELAKYIWTSIPVSLLSGFPVATNIAERSIFTFLLEPSWLPAMLL